ncbi:MAG: DUF3108 domain-containing protein [Bacteroidota bacterium]
MKKLGVGICLLALLTAFSGDRNDIYPPIKNDSFSRGEVLNFKMTYGIFTVGKGSASIHHDYITFNDRQCFKVDVTGRTVGMVDWVADVNDQWGAYIDTSALVPHMFYRKIREGRYRKDEQTLFDHVNKKIEVKVVDKQTGKFKEPKFYEAPAQVRDMIGGFLYLRIMDFSKLQVNDTVLITGFFEDEFYKLRIVYKGKETIKTKVGRVRTLVFKPVMPKNQLFDGENSITAWFSDDKNRIPVKISAEMFIGSAGVELISFSGLRNPLNIRR